MPKALADGVACVIRRPRLDGKVRLVRETALAALTRVGVGGGVLRHLP